METLFGILLIICSIAYSIRVFSWLWIVISKKRVEKFDEQTKIKKHVLYLSGIEHFIYMVTLIGSAIILL
jgi:hypothetical protein